MREYEALCPGPPGWTVPWAQIRERFAWVRAMTGVPQDAVHHAEGDVEIHTRMACEALAELPEWRARPAAERVRLFATVLMHDIAKPYCTQTDSDGRITAHGHSRRGDLLVRRALWQLGAPIADREHVEQLRAAGRLRGAREALLVADRVERARLARVRAAGERDFGAVVGGQLLEAVRADEELRLAERICGLGGHVGLCGWGRCAAPAARAGVAMV